MLKLIFFSLMSQAAIGALVPMAFMSVETMGKLFYRFMSGLAVVLLVLSFWASPFDNIVGADSQSAQSKTVATAYVLLASSVLALVVMNLALPSWAKFFLWTAIVFGFAATALVAGLFPEAERVVRPAAWLNAFSFLSSALLLGGVVGTMITGHWYLVNHKLSIQPLRVATIIFIVASALRFLLVTAMLAGLWMGGEASQVAAIRHLFTFSGEGIFFIARLLFGLMAPLIFGYMIWQTVKLHSTQSATGILYAAVVFVILGEAFSKFIFYFMNLPV
jgi:protein NrfD